MQELWTESAQISSQLFSVIPVLSWAFDWTLEALLPVRACACVSVFVDLVFFFSLLTLCQISYFLSWNQWYALVTILNAEKDVLGDSDRLDLLLDLVLLLLLDLLLGGLSRSAPVLTVQIWMDVSVYISVGEYTFPFSVRHGWWRLCILFCWM